MGDVAMMVPVVHALAVQYPHVRVTVLSKPFARPFFEALAPNVGFMAVDPRKEAQGLHGLNVLYRRLVAKRFTAIADFHDVLRTKYLRMRFNVDRFPVAHINKHRSGKRKLTAEKGKRLEQQPTSFQNYADVLARLGYPVKMEFTSLFDGRNAACQDLPIKYGSRAKEEHWIGIAPFAAHRGKIYPLRKMREVIALWTAQHPQDRIFLFGGGKEECAQLDALVDAFPNCVNVASLSAGLSEELVLMKHLDVMVSMDSANMHLASLVALPVVSVWGATHPYAGFMGWGQREETAVQVDLPCRPCSIYGNKPCLRGDYACMEQIMPKRIVDSMNAVLQG